MEKVDMKKLLNNWRQSAKYAEFQLKKQQFKNKLHQLNERAMEQGEYMTDFELEQTCDLLIEIYSIKESESEIETFDDYLNTFGTGEEIIKDHAGQLSIWYIYMYKMIRKEKYEIAAKIKKVIQLEKEEFIKTIKFFRHDLYSDEEFMDAFDFSYSTYDKLLIEKLGL
jgi:hypothetical protein